MSDCESDSDSSSCPGSEYMLKLDFKRIIAKSIGPHRNSTSKLRWPHQTSNKDHRHGEDVASSGGMGLVVLLNPTQDGPSKVLAEAAVEWFSKIQ